MYQRMKRSSLHHAEQIPYHTIVVQFTRISNLLLCATYGSSSMAMEKLLHSTTSRTSLPDCFVFPADQVPPATSAAVSLPEYPSSTCRAAETRFAVPCSTPAKTSVSSRLATSHYVLRSKLNQACLLRRRES